MQTICTAVKIMAKGFFKTIKVETSPIRTTGCASCGLSNGCLHPKMEPTGKGKKGILIVAEAPGEAEDRIGTQLIGKVGQRVRKTFKRLGFDLDEDCRKTNSVVCRPPDNRTPTELEINSCRHRVFEEIKQFQPKVIIAMGGPALVSLLGPRWKHDSDMSISRWRGLTIPDTELGAYLCPTYHPSYVERIEAQTPAVDVIWTRDLKRALALHKSPTPKPLKPKVFVLEGRELYSPYERQSNHSLGYRNHRQKALPGRPPNSLLLHSGK
jgi:uracil-DNA glycosylase